MGLTAVFSAMNLSVQSCPVRTPVFPFSVVSATCVLPSSQHVLSLSRPDKLLLLLLLLLLMMMMMMRMMMLLVQDGGGD